MHWSDPGVITNVILAAITFFYLVATVFIWHATWQNTKATRQVLEATHRPYVGVTGMRLFRDDLTGDTVLRTSVANVGSVPARNVKVALKLQINNSTIIGGQDAAGDSGTVALLPQQDFVFSTTIPTESSPELHQESVSKAIVHIDYSSMNDKQYGTDSTYAYGGDVEFVIESAHFL